MSACLALDLNSTLSSFDELNKFMDHFNSELKSKYDSIILKIPKDYQMDKSYVPYDLLTFFDLYYKDKVVILDKELYKPDLSFVFHFLCHTNKSEIKVNFDIDKITSLIEYSTFKSNISILSECISSNGFNSCINMAHIINDEFIKKYLDGELTDYINFIKDIKNAKFSILNKVDDNTDTYAIIQAIEAK